MNKISKPNFLYNPINFSALNILIELITLLSSSNVVKVYWFKLHVLRNVFWLFFFWFLKKLINLIFIFFFVFKFVIIVMPCIPGLSVEIVFKVVLIILVVAILAWAWLSTAFVVDETRTVFFKTVGLFAWAIYKRVTCGIDWLFVLTERVQMHVFSLRERMLFANFKLNFFLFPVKQSIWIIFTAFAFTELGIALSSLSITAAIHFEALDIFTEASVGRMSLLFFGKKLIFEFNALHAAKTDDTEFIGIQKAVAMLANTLLKRTVAFVHVFLGVAATVLVCLIEHLFWFWFWMEMYMILLRLWNFFRFWTDSIRVCNWMISDDHQVCYCRDRIFYRGVPIPWLWFMKIGTK